MNALYLTENRWDRRLEDKDIADTVPTPLRERYLVLTRAEIGMGLIRPVRVAYRHSTCGAVTRVCEEIALTWAREPKFYAVTYCVRCRMHRPVSEFFWIDSTDLVGS